MLEYEDIGEGLCGEYNPEDPSDIPLLRADLYTTDSFYGDHDYGPVEKHFAVRDCSYCTLAKVGTSEYELAKAAHELFDELGDNPGSPKRIMERWTWRKYE